MAGSIVALPEPVWKPRKRSFANHGEPIIAAGELIIVERIGDAFAPSQATGLAHPSSAIARPNYAFSHRLCMTAYFERHYGLDLPPELLPASRRQIVLQNRDELDAVRASCEPNESA